MIRFSFISTLILLGAVLGHVYLYRRLVRHLVASPALRRGIVGLFCAMGLLMLLRRVLRDVLPESFEEPVSVVLYAWMGAALFVVLALLVLDLGRGLVTVGWRVSRAPPVDVERRRFLARTVAGGALVSGGGTAAYGSWRALTPPQVTEVVLKIPRLPRALDGLSIVQLTDIHVGPFIQRRYMDELVRRTNALRPDLVAITGDLVDGDVPTLGAHVAALGALRSRFGGFFVTGNHDYYSGDVEWVAFLESLGIQALRNRHVRIGDAGGSLDLVGVDDWSGGKRFNRRGYDLDQALEGRDPDRAAVLLAHQPANFPVAAARGIDAQISGHTHGGQLPPMTFLIGLEWEYTAGLYQHGDSRIFVSRGCGFWGPPMRVGSPPEIVKLVLTA
ncbi:metallophosphoesterase [Cystobacter fuscus DSM 2262]|uniref:Metallophosphoesterase n=1 Tax=Cystobacter fuscus (strain ATCC 25194 / DSM 2262 / NBRC 100088 / M29) TaxID=1242864 RepID=S9P1V2_CYSF2|nr:metallophosphoesterase [Cystobacter fuscus]EPX57091.1 metallophosphoesterase [Cystobacter fuscus DSM 2262]